MFSNYSLGRKLLLVNLFTGLLILVFAGTLLVLRDQSQRQKLFEQRIEQQGALIAANATAAVVFEDWSGVEEILASLKTDPAVIGAEVFDQQGVSQTKLEIATDSLGLAYGAAVPVMDDGNIIGEVRVYATNREVRAAWGATLRSVTLATLIALAIGFVFSARIQAAVIKPIRRLSRLVREIQENKSYHLRAEITYRDEIGQLMMDVNEMLAAIEGRDQYLEQQVSERTRQLEEKNVELSKEVRTRELAHLELRTSQEKFLRAFEDAPIGMALVSSSGYLHQVNGQFAELLKLDPEAENWLKDVIVDSDMENVLGLCSKLVEGVEDAFDVEVTCRAGDGSSLICVLSFSALRAEGVGFLHFVLQVQDVTEARSLSSELTYQANHDTLTGLANRRAFDQALEKLKNLPDVLQSCSLCLIDLDQFKVINDTCGHGAGDMLLRQVADLLSSRTRSGDLLVRLGGDEFAVLLYNCDQDGARRVAEAIRAEVEQFVFPWEDRSFRIGASIGVVTAKRGACDPIALMQQADAACFTAKELGRNRVHCVFSDDEEIRHTQGEMHWVGRLHEAMDSNAFILFVQDVVPLKNPDQPPRYEILLRLRDFRSDKIIPPGAFLPAAERYGLSTKVDQWVVRHLISTLHSYCEVLKEDACYWVNLSGRSIGDRAFLSFLEQEIARANLPKGMLNFEITETEMIQNIADASDVMNRLKTFGCQFALDDFGSGLSSFGYLKSLPVDFIKIDGMFVRDIVDDSVDRVFVKSIIDIARVMGIQSIAEFVETDEVLRVVSELGADFGQGFALGRPRPLLPSSLLVKSKDASTGALQTG